jgi:arylformamidase
MKMYDISVPLHAKMTTWPGDPVFKKEMRLRIKKGGPVNLGTVSMGLHNGTHFDAPYHVVDSGKTFDRIPPEVYTGDALVVDMGNAKVIDRPGLEGMDFQGTRRVLFRTTNSAYLEKGRPFRKDFVHFTGDAAEYLAKRKKIRMVAIDYLSVDRFKSDGHPAHKAFINNGVLILETVNLYRIKPGKYRIFCGPLPVRGADGAPARVFLIKE